MVLLLAQGCTYTVRATGLVSTVEGALTIQGSNGKSRPLLAEGDAAALHWLDGLLVDLDGTLRKGVIEVASWRITEGPHGLSAWTGIVVKTPRGYALDVHDQGGRLTLGRSASLEAHLGRPVLIEGLVDVMAGMVDGGMSVQVMYVVPLYGAVRPSP